MNKLARRLISAVLSILVFAGGVGVGVYYQNEIMVIWRSLVSGEVAGTSDVQEADQPAKVAESTVELPGLEDPLPLVFSETLEEPVIQEHLKNGAVVLPLGTSFGETGNVVVTAHSSGTEAFGPYRFAFAKLSELEEGQEYTIVTPKARYTYKVYAKEIVWPHQVDRLPNDDRSTVTLVTCWPLWTNFQRLLVHTELVDTEFNV